MVDYLEALERLAMPDELHISECEKLGISLTEDFDLVEQALLELTSIKEAKPSKALECLDRIDNTLCLNNIKGKLDFGIDTEEHSDCDSVTSMTEDLEYIKQALINVQEQELIKGGRLPNKEILYLKQSLEQYNDTPIFYISRTYGNKYIVPQKQFDDLTNENELLKGQTKYFTEVVTEFQEAIRIIKEKNVDILDVKLYENYEHYCTAKEDSRLRKDWWLTKEEFDLLKKVFG